MKLKRLKLAPLLTAAGVVGLVCAAQIWWPGVFERLELMTYDWRVKHGVNNSPLISTNLGFVSISDQTLDAIHDRLVENSSYGLKWPRHIYGRVAAELADEGATAVAFDVLFAELRPDHPPLPPPPGQTEPLESDDLFVLQIREADNVILAAEQNVTPPRAFRDAARALGDITAEKDIDGVLRRAKAFRIYRKWHRAFLLAEENPEYGVNLNKAVITPSEIILPRTGSDATETNLEPFRVPLDTNGNFDLVAMVGKKLPAGMERYAKPFTSERIWHMGIVMAAQQLKLDLDKAQVDLPRGRIVLPDAKGIDHVLPVDGEGYFFINWCLNTSGKDLMQEPFEEVAAQYQARTGWTNALVERYLEERKGRSVNWTNKLVLVGSSAVGNDLTDRGVTPLAKDTLLASEHWNVANSLLTGQFVHRAGLPVSLAFIIVLGVLTAYLTGGLRSFVALFWVFLIAAAYVVLATWVYVRFRYWLPIVAPVTGGPLLTSLGLLTYLILFEQRERRRLRSVFTKVVSPDVVAELEGMEAEKLALTGARRNVTVLFADIRGFTEMTDVAREKAEDYIADHRLTGVEAEVVRDAQARETISTVNQYLTIVAEAVLRHKGTVDKFIGDCVMAFWGAPIANPKHALTCVQAAIEAQRAIFKLNFERSQENQRRETENLRLAAEGKPPLPILSTLVLGSGINTGVVTVGLMGSEQMLNYTVFGRDVNLASRLESVSGRGRIIISEATLAEIIQDDPTLALSCKELPPEKVKGFRVPVKIYEVPWREDGSAASHGDTNRIAQGEYHTGYFTAKEPGK